MSSVNTSTTNFSNDQDFDKHVNSFLERVSDGLCAALIKKNISLKEPSVSVWSSVDHETLCHGSLDLERLNFVDEKVVWYTSYPDLYETEIVLYEFHRIGGAIYAFSCLACDWKVELVRDFGVFLSKHLNQGGSVVLQDGSLVPLSEYVN